LKEFRDRVLLPLLVPLVAAAIIVVVVLNFSQVLLALEETASAALSTVVAIAAASAILFGCTYFSARGEERSPQNVAVLASAGMVIVFSGFIGLAAIEEHERELAAKEPKEQLKPDVTVRAFDIGFRETQLQAAAGDVAIELVNEGAVHTFLFDEVPGFKLEVGSRGDKDIDSVKLEPGTYTYFCDVPGHRSAGMEGKLNVTPGGGAEAAPPGGEQAGGEGAGGGGGGRLEIVAKEGPLSLEPKELSVPGGPVEITYRSEGQLLHTLLVDEVPQFKRLEVPSNGATARGTLDVGPGTYTLYCDQPGHREQGMEAKLTVG
jgi:plastocyanin